MLVLPYIRALFIFNEIECGENVGAVFADGDGVLEVGGGLAVFGAAGPAVLLGELDILGPHTDHGFYGYDHAFFEQGAGAGDSIVGDVGAFVHFEAYAMAAEFTDDGVAVFLTVLLDGVSDVAHTVAFFAFLKPNIKCLLGDLKKPLHLGRAFATDESVRRIADVSVVLNHTVERDIVAFFDEDIVAGNPMYHHVVDRNAEGGRKTFIAFAQGDAPVVADELVAYLVEEGGGDTGMNMTAHLRQGFPEEASTVTYQFDFFLCL